MIELLQTALAFVFAISILVTVHEYGHFYAARKLGFKVEKLSIGFGKALISWRSRDGEVEYVIAAIPLGGYVKMLGESSGESLTEDKDNQEVSKDKSRSYELMPIWKRSTVAFAGPFFNLAFAIILFMIIGWTGKEITLPVAGYIVKDSSAYISGIKSGDRIVSINNNSVFSWQNMEETIRPLVGKEIKVRVERKGKEIDFSVKLNPTKNDPMLSDSVYESLGLSKKQVFFIEHINKNSAAEKAGLEKGEIITLNGISPESPVSLVDQIKNSNGGSVEFKILTKNNIEKVFSVHVDKDKPVIGITFNFKSNTPKELYRLDLIDGFYYGFERTWDMTVMITHGIGKLLNGNISSEYISGPITIAQISERSMASGFVSFLVFLAIISLNLGIMNLLPIPVLDGGHLVFLAIEKVKGSAIEPIILEKVQYTGLIMILGLMFFAMYNDIVRIIL